MDQERYVTSASISHTRDRFEHELMENLRFIRSLLGTVGVDGDGFGIAGEWVMRGDYEHMCAKSDDKLKEALDVVDGWCKALTIAQRNWRAAEDNSVVRYR